MATKTLITPEVELSFPYLTETDKTHNPDGNYSVVGVYRGEAAEAVVKEIDRWYAAHVEATRKLKPQIREAGPPYKVREDGSVSVKFVCKSVVRPKKGDPFTQRPALYDANAEPWPEGKRINYGSVGKIAYVVVPYDSFGAGLSFRLKAVQVISEREYSFGFTPVSSEPQEVADGFKPVARPTNAPIFQNPQTMPTPRPEAGQPVHAPQRYVAPPREDVKSNLVPQDTGWDDLPF